MTLFLRIAWRNITRNKFRSFITIAAIALGFASLVFIRAFVDGSHHQMIENYTDLLSGHIQLHTQGFTENPSLLKTISDPARLDSLLSQNPAITASAKRVKEYVLLSSAENSTSALILGIDQKNEPKVTKLHKRISAGTFLSENTDIVIGKGIAKLLQIGLKDKIVLVSQGFDGSLVSAVYRVSGILDTGAEEIDKGIALITLSAAQELFVLENRVSEIVLKVNSVENAARIAQGLSQQIDPGFFEVISWEKISPIIVQWVEFDVAFINLILGIVLVVVAAGILNTLLMGILERTREFGIMLALGTKRSYIVRIVTLESLLLGVIGIILGYLLGVSFSFYFSVHGINLASFATALNNYYTGSIIYTRISGNSLVVYGVTVLVTSIIVSAYPAWRAANLKPVEALYKI